MAGRGDASPVQESGPRATLSVTLVSATGLHGSKQPGFTLSAVAVFDGREAPAKTADEELSLEVPGPDLTDLHLVSEFEIPVESQSSVETAANSPIQIRLQELIKDVKKKKVEITVNELASGLISLEPMLSGATEFETQITVMPATEETAGEESVPIKVVVKVALTAPLMSESMRSTSNLLSVRATVYSLPDNATFAPGPTGGTYELVFPIPHKDGRSMTLMDGVCIGHDHPHSGNHGQHGHSHHRSHTAKSASHRATSAGHSTHAPAPEEPVLDEQVAAPSAPSSGLRTDEQGAMRGAEDYEFRKNAETLAPRVQWQRQEIRYLSTDVSAAIQTDVPKSRIVPVEFRRYAPEPKEKGAKGKASKIPGEEERGPPGFFGMALVDVAPLLFPGATSLRGAYPIVPLNPAEVAEACAAATGFAAPSRPQPDDDDTAGGGSGKGKKGGDKKKEATADEAGSPDAAVYKDARTYVLLDVQLTKPIVPKRTVDDVALEVAELIPPRAIYPRNAGGGDKSISDFKVQVTAVASQLLGEYRKQENNTDSGLGNRDSKIRQSLLYELNTSGKYYAYKESLKRAVVKVAREKFEKTAAIADPSERAAFLGELYRFLVDRMQETLCAEFSFAASQKPAEIEITVAHIRTFAMEAEAIGDNDRASMYHQEAISRNKASLENWYFYGCFCLRVADYLKADECFQECISINQRHVGALLLGAIVQWKLDKLDAMRVLLDGATVDDGLGMIHTVAHEGMHAAAWAIRSLLHELTDNSVDRDMAAAEASRRSKEGEARTYLQAALFLQPVSIPILFEAATVRCTAAGPSDEDALVLQIAIGRSLLQLGKLPEAEKVIKRCVATQFSDFRVRALEGHLRFQQAAETGNYEAAMQAYEHALELTASGGTLMHTMMSMHMPEAVAAESIHWDEHTLRERLGKICMQSQKYSRAKDVYLGACAKSPTALVWEGVGTACYRLGQLAEAEEALAESNIYDSTNARVWGYLALICTRTGRRVEAEQAYNFAISRSLNDPDLLGEIKAAQEMAGFGNPFVDTQT